MRPRSAVILTVIAAIVLAAGWWFGPRESGRERAPAPTARLAFPDLTAKLAKARRIEMVHQGKTMELDRTAQGWSLKEQSGYPALPSRVHGLLAGPSITEGALLAGVWDYAAVKVFEANWADFSMGTISVRDGHLGQVRLDRGTFRAGRGRRSSGRVARGERRRRCSQTARQRFVGVWLDRNRLAALRLARSRGPRRER